MKANKGDRVTLINGKSGLIVKTGLFKCGDWGFMVKTTDLEMYIVENKDIVEITIETPSGESIG